MTKMQDKNSLTDRELKVLVQKASTGRITRAEVEQIASDFSKREQLYSRTYAIGRSMFPEFIPVLKELAEQELDFDAAGMALNFLIIYHGQHDLIPNLIAAIDGKEEDFLDQLRRAAISTAGEFLRENQNAKLLRSILVALKEHPKSYIRERAYRALLRASGVEHKDMPNPARDFPEDQFDQTLISKMEVRAKIVSLNS